MPPPDEIPSAPLVGVWHFSRLPDAREAALALAARGLLYEIDAVGKDWVLLVEEHAAEEALRELTSLAAAEPAVIPAEAAPLEPIRAASLIVPALVMSAFFQVQMWLGERWTEAGLADGQAMLGHGEWWRAVTALTLHGDLGHFLANLLTGLMFAVFLQAELGSGVAWLLVLASGALGNAINAWGYRGQAHYSLGASTAVFGALGLLVVGEFCARWRSPATRHHWSLIVPLGAGLSFLAYLGVGDGHDRVDFMAHGWGFLSGLVIGLVAAVATGGRRASPVVQWVAAAAVAAVLATAWWLALHRGGT
ncbi:MAG TPA: rhomboid family intramembrane serine protease [Chthoniobacteraceae bacterium]|nr:rhomboid family intramembrane serine protease [Chthoniobacteraceae bacterium]